MLRGINVSGHKVIKMDELKKLYESFGFFAVKTYIQSGNVIFATQTNNQEEIGSKIKSEIEKKFGFIVPVIIRTKNEIQNVLTENPFINMGISELDKMHVTFLENKPKTEFIEKLPVNMNTTDQFKLIGREIYLFCPEGYGKTLLNNNFFEKHLKVSATTRNWKTVNKLYEIS